ncbi:metalloendoproteinase 5-MMP-like [Macadamia integrifolia]|uniref:metalloendoproteinase 5-MMP-like n=1 Tax=Macadamia integrifolia TaxID=60698 RepID=UPI001C4F518E|nr:metalloendoproteinase 5-MMP-like [Macadamia integrifolia]
MIARPRCGDADIINGTASMNSGEPSHTTHHNLTSAFFPGKQLKDNAIAVFTRAFQRYHGDGEAFDGRLGTLAHAFSLTSGLFHPDRDEEWVVDEDVT